MSKNWIKETFAGTPICTYMSCIAKKKTISCRPSQQNPSNAGWSQQPPAGYVPRSDGGGKSGGSRVCYLKVGLFEIGKLKIHQD